MSWKKKLLRLLGTNETRMSWKWRRFKDGFKKKDPDAENERTHMGYQHKHCPACRSLVDKDETKCPSCGAAVPSMAAVKAERALVSLLPEESPTTKILLAVLLGIFVVMVFDGMNQVGEGNALAVILSPPGEVMYRWGAHVRGFMDPWRIVMSNFIHFGLLHLGFNAWALKVAGPEVERAYGSGLTLVLFLATGIAGMVLSNQVFVAGTPDNLFEQIIGGQGIVAGASASIMGLLGAAAVAGHRDQTTRGRHVRDAMVKWALFVMFIGIAASTTGMMSIANMAHLGGLLAGVGLAFLLPLRPRAGFPSLTTRRLVMVGVVVTLGMIGAGVYGMVRNQLGDVAFKQCYEALRDDKFEEAIPVCEEAVKNHPTSIAAINNLAYALLRSGRGDDALALCREAVEEFGKSDVRKEAPTCAELL